MEIARIKYSRPQWPQNIYKHIYIVFFIIYWCFTCPFLEFCLRCLTKGNKNDLRYLNNFVPFKMNSSVQMMRKNSAIFHSGVKTVIQNKSVTTRRKKQETIFSTSDQQFFTGKDNISKWSSQPPTFVQGQKTKYYKSLR